MPNLRFLLSAILACLFTTLSAQVEEFPQTFSVYFDTDKADLREEALIVLESVGQAVEAYSDYRIELQAHTDNRGDHAYNDRLAKDRAAAVHLFLAARGIQSAKTSVVAFGETRPAYSNADDDGRQKNRRVDVILTGMRWPSLTDLMEALHTDPAPVFRFASDQNVEVTGAQGTRVWIEANAFEFADGSGVPGEIEFSLKECYQTSDMILSGLGTASGDRLLETGGMLKMEASADGKPLQLKESARMIVAMPADQLKDGMQLFTGIPNPSGGVNDWQPTGQGYTPSLNDLVDLPERPHIPGFSFVPPLYQRDLSKMPKAPASPAKPIEPRKPKRESVKYNPGFIQRLVEGQKGIEAKEEAAFEKKMADYETRMERYQQQMIAYEEKLIEHKQALEAHQLAVEQWKADQEQEALRYQLGGDIYEAAREKQWQEYAVKEKWNEKRLDKWKAARDAKLASFEEHFEKVGSISDVRSLSNYFFKVSDLGWINCDRFMNIPADEKRQLAIRRNPAAEEKVYIVFKDINSVLQAYPSDEIWKTSQVPRNADVRIVGVKVEEGKALLAVEDTTVEDHQGLHDLTYRPAKLSEIREALEALN